MPCLTHTYIRHNVMILLFPLTEVMAAKPGSQEKFHVSQAAIVACYEFWSCFTHLKSSNLDLWAQHLKLVFSHKQHFLLLDIIHMHNVCALLPQCKGGEGVINWRRHPPAQCLSCEFFLFFRGFMELLLKLPWCILRRWSLPSIIEAF